MKDKLIVEERMKQFDKDLLHWKKYDFERPDYKAYVKRMKKRETVTPEPVVIKSLPADTSTNKKVEWQDPK